MMTLDKLHKDDKAIITKINCDEVLKHRLSSFGLMRATEIKVKAFSLKKKTIEVEVGRSFIALRFEEAEKIEVKKV